MPRQQSTTAEMYSGRKFVVTIRDAAAACTKDLPATAAAKIINVISKK